MKEVKGPNVVAIVVCVLVLVEASALAAGLVWMYAVAVWG